MRARWLVVLLGAAVARAAPGGDLEMQIRALSERPEREMAAPRFAMNELDVRATDQQLASANLVLTDINTRFDRIAIGQAGDGKSAWLAADVQYLYDCGSSPSCGKTMATGHLTGLFERSRDGWQPVVWNVTSNTSAARQAAAIKNGRRLVAVPAKVDGADDAVKYFQATIGDPKALAASVSDRKDVLLYGSEERERYMGAQVKAKLAAWKLVFKVHDGIRAGLAAGGTVAWVAANLDATSAAGATPYRALFIYERRANRWTLVQAQFSFGDW
jgi:hypothetical protein